MKVSWLTHVGCARLTHQQDFRSAHCAVSGIARLSLDSRLMRVDASILVPVSINVQVVRGVQLAAM